MDAIVQDVQHYFGRQLRSRRALLGLKQADLGKAAGIPQVFISRYERGRFDGMPLDRLVRLAHALQTTPNALLGVGELE